MPAIPVTPLARRSGAVWIALKGGLRKVRRSGRSGFGGLPEKGRRLIRPSRRAEVADGEDTRAAGPFARLGRLEAHV
jgi:hypothetical protein